MTTSHWVVFEEYPSVFEAEIDKAALEEAGIPVLMKGNHSGMFGAGFQGTVTGGVELQVPDTALMQAREVLGISEDAAE